jgi:hypothetical protein
MGGALGKPFDSKHPYMKYSIGCGGSYFLPCSPETSVIKPFTVIIYWHFLKSVCWLNVCRPNGFWLNIYLPNGFWPNVYLPNGNFTKCLSAKWFLTNCLLGKWFLTKCLSDKWCLTKCLSAKCILTKCLPPKWMVFDQMFVGQMVLDRMARHQSRWPATWKWCSMRIPCRGCRILGTGLWRRCRRVTWQDDHQQRLKTVNSLAREYQLRGKAQYSWPPLEGRLLCKRKANNIFNKERC